MGYKINRCMKYFDNFLPIEFIDEVENYTRSILFDPVWQNAGITVHKNLGHTFTEDDLNTYIAKHLWPWFAKLPEEFKQRLFKYLLEEKTVLKKTPKQFFTHLHHSGPLESYPWHTDVHSEYHDPDYTGDNFDGTMGITIYLNKNWDQDWGGYFLYKDSKDATSGGFVQPVYNRAVFNNGKEYHAVSGTGLRCDVRLSIQIFVSMSAVNDEYLS